VLAVFLVLLATGWATGPLEQTAWGAARARQPELNLRDLQGALGQGLVMGVLGGFRTIMADFSWISAYYSWAKQDPITAPQTEALIYLTTLLDPQSVYFWSNGASIIGKDIPSWYVRRGRKITQDEYMTIKREQGERAQQLLDRGLTFHPQNWVLLRDKAMIYQWNMLEPEASVESWRRAAEAPGAPYYLARVYAELLANQGRTREAYDYYRKLYPTLPNKVPAAAKDVVWERLRELEDTLKLPPDQRLPASDAPPGYQPPAPDILAPTH
jgi:tetratricopeptide (TPR) repeat protein